MALKLLASLRCRPLLADVRVGNLLLLNTEWFVHRLCAWSLELQMGTRTHLIWHVASTHGRTPCYEAS